MLQRYRPCYIGRFVRDAVDDQTREPSSSRAPIKRVGHDASSLMKCYAKFS